MSLRIVVTLLILGLASSTAPRAQEPAAPADPAAPSDAQAAKRPPGRSRITVPIHIPIAQIRAALQARIPKDQSGAGTGETVCKSVFGLKLCVGTRYDYRITRTGDVSVAPGDHGLRLRVPLKVTGHGGLKGPEAEALRLDARDFRAAADVDVLIGLTVKPDWCMETPAQIHYAWTETPRVEIASGTWVDVEGLVRKQLDTRLASAARTLSNAIPCKEVQSALKRAWALQVVPIKLPNVQDLSLVIDPQGFGISELEASADEVKLVLSGNARTYFTATPPVSRDKGALPPPSPVPGEPDRASLAIVTYAPFVLMRSVALQAAARPIAVSIGPLSGAVTITDLAFRQAGQSLGVDVSYSLAGIGDAPQTGIMHLEGMPTVAEDGRSITLEGATISPGSSQSLPPALAGALNEALRLVLSRRRLVDLGPRLDEIERSLSGLSSDPTKTKGLRISVRNAKVRLGGIVIGPDGLSGTATATGDVSVDLAALQKP